MLFVGTSITCRSLIINIRTYSNEVILIFNACKMSPKFIIFNFFWGGGWKPGAEIYRGTTKPTPFGKGNNDDDDEL